MCLFLLAFQFPASLRQSEQTASSLPTDLGRPCMWLTLPIFGFRYFLVRSKFLSCLHPNQSSPLCYKSRAEEPQS
jgi:hypothetical protein